MSAERILRAKACPVNCWVAGETGRHLIFPVSSFPDALTLPVPKTVRGRSCREQAERVQSVPGRFRDLKADLVAVGQQIRKSVNQINGQRTSSVSTDDEGLFDVCGFAGSRDKTGKAVLAHWNSAVGLMQVV